MQKDPGAPGLIRAAEWITLVAVAVLYLGLNSATWVISPDSTTYVEGARSLASFRGFADGTGAPITIVPPGASAVYSLAAVIPSPAYWYFNLATKGFVLGFLALSFLVIRRSAGRGAALISVVFFALSTTLLTESTRILSDLPFSAMFMLTLWLFPEERLEGLSTGNALLLGGLLSCCYLLRTAGLFAYLGYAACILCCVRSNRTSALARVSAVFLAGAVLLGVRAIRFANGPSYLQTMATRELWVADSGQAGWLDLYQRCVVNLITTLSDIVELCSNTEGLRFGAVVICALVSAGLAVGVVRRRRRLLVFFLMAYLPALLLAGPQRRYLLPILPLLALFASDGAWLVWRWLPEDRIRRTAWVALLIVLCVGPFGLDGYRYARRLRLRFDRAGGETVIYPGHESLLDLVRTNSDRVSRSDVIATMHANVLRYFVPTGVAVTDLPLLVNVDKAYQAIRDSGSTYVYCDTVETDIWSHIDPIIRKYPSSFELVAENAGARVYRVVP